MSDLQRHLKQLADGLSPEAWSPEVRQRVVRALARFLSEELREAERWEVLRKVTDR